LGHDAALIFPSSSSSSYKHPTTCAQKQKPGITVSPISKKQHKIKYNRTITTCRLLSNVILYDLNKNFNRSTVLLKIFPILNQAKIHFANLKLLYAADARVISAPYKQGKSYANCLPHDKNYSNSNASFCSHHICKIDTSVLCHVIQFSPLRFPHAALPEA